MKTATRFARFFEVIIPCRARGARPEPTIARGIAFSFAPLVAALLLVQPCAATPFQWSFTDSLDIARSQHTATLLQNGMVLLAGGFDSSNGDTFASAELYDPASGTWSPTGSMNIARSDHTATLLPNGMVLVAGGTVDRTTELYDPASGTWSFTGDMKVGHFDASAVLLANGKVLLTAGGANISELYDPASGNWSLTGTTVLKHGGFSSHVPLTLLPNGMALLEGGLDEHSVPRQGAELYDPTSGTWSLTGSMNTGRVSHTATLLPNGLVLVAGGEDPDSSELASAELYDSASGTWSLTGSLSTEHTRHTATLLADGKVLVASGVEFHAAFTKVSELYDPASGIWSATGSLNTARADFTATLLPNGMVLAAAGYGGGITVLNSAELYDPGIGGATEVDGRGSIAGQAGRASFNFHATLAEDRGSGALTFLDPAAGISLSRGKIRSLTINGNSADLSGNGKLGDGTRVTFEVSVTDNGDGNSDSFAISLSNGYAAGGTLSRGDIQIR